jgi:predicted nucleotidyltransferase
MKIEASYPTFEHRRASEEIINFFSGWSEVEAVMLTGSCTHGGATRDSCLDITVIVPTEILSSKNEELEAHWKEFYESEEVFKRLLGVGAFSHVDMIFTDGCFKPQPRGFTSGPDEFELEIGNTLVYSVPLWSRGDRLQRLKAEWLPYYGEELRSERLAMVDMYFHNNLDHIPLFVDRGLHFQAFNRLYDAFREFIQAIFISRRTYPIAYDKWIRKQFHEILGEPEVYRSLVKILEIEDFEGRDIADRAEDLRGLFKKHIAK